MGWRIPDIGKLLGQIAFQSPAKELGALVDGLGHIELGIGVLASEKYVWTQLASSYVV